MSTDKMALPREVHSSVIYTNPSHIVNDAVVDAGAVRFRPMMLTAAAVIVGSAVILFDPIFQGLAISLMAGEVASLFLSRMTVPVLFYLSERKKHTHLQPSCEPIKPTELIGGAQGNGDADQEHFVESAADTSSTADEPTSETDVKVEEVVT